jgi:hypothetical protein
LKQYRSWVIPIELEEAMPYLTKIGELHTGLQFCLTQTLTIHNVVLEGTQKWPESEVSGSGRSLVLAGRFSFRSQRREQQFILLDCVEVDPMMCRIRFGLRLRLDPVLANQLKLARRLKDHPELCELPVCPFWRPERYG